MFQYYHYFGETPTRWAERIYRPKYTVQMRTRAFQTSRTLAVRVIELRIIENTWDNRKYPEKAAGDVSGNGEPEQRKG